MKTCLNCQKEYEAKREASKFCSDRCRVAYNRKNPKNSVTKVQMQVLYNAMMGAVDIINKFSGELPKDFQKIESVGILKDNGEIEALSFEKLREQEIAKKDYQWYVAQLNAAEDLGKLEKIGREIEKNKELLWKEKQNLKQYGQQVAQAKFID